jgi:protein tyrosine phosphatase
MGTILVQTLAAVLQACNRYYDCLPFDFNRVILFREEEHETGYINASHLQSPDEDDPDWHYIVGQVPPPPKHQSPVHANIDNYNKYLRMNVLSV